MRHALLDDTHFSIILLKSTFGTGSPEQNFLTFMPCSSSWRAAVEGLRRRWLHLWTSGRWESSGAI